MFRISRGTLLLRGRAAPPAAAATAASRSLSTLSTSTTTTTTTGTSRVVYATTGHRPDGSQSLLQQQPPLPPHAARQQRRQSPRAPHYGWARHVSTKASEDEKDKATTEEQGSEAEAKESKDSDSPPSKEEEERMEKEEAEEKKKKKRREESFEETVKRMQGEGGGSSSSFFDAAGPAGDYARRAADLWSSFSVEVGETWNELINAGKRKDINKKIHPVATAEGDEPYTGPVSIMVIDPSENLTAWERMQKRLTEAPIIQNILSHTEHAYEKSGARQVKERADVIVEDAREAWETSQNPWVYRVSSVYDTLTAETPESIAVKELRQLDPEFTLEDWRRDVVEHTLPLIMSWFLEGRINQLKPWLGEGVFKRIAAEITARKQEGVQIDTHVLGIMNSEILAVEPDEVEKGSPIIVLHFMVQQINCVRKKEDGAVVEGSEDDIRANSYVTAFQREYDEERGELNWKIVDFRFNGAIAYL